MVGTFGTESKARLPPNFFDERTVIQARLKTNVDREIRIRLYLCDRVRFVITVAMGIYFTAVLLDPCFRRDDNIVGKM